MTEVRVALELTARQFADRLRSLALDGVFVASDVAVDGPLHKDGGWAATIAELSSGPTIQMFADQYIASGLYTCWIGFHSDQRPLGELVQNLPDQFQQRQTFNSSKFKDVDGVAVLKNFLKRELLNVTILERYKDGSEYFGYFGAELTPDLDRAVKFISNIIVVNRDHLDDESVDIRRVREDDNIPVTQKMQLIAARRGQGTFRKGLEDLWPKGCPVTGHAARELLRASHIKPWRDSNNKQRLNPYNGILLAAHIDALFDQHLLTFAEDGSLEFSDLLSADEVRRLNLPEGLKVRFQESHAPFLGCHRETFAAKKFKQQS